LRTPDADKEKLLAAAFLTEILTIELYNLRLSNIGDPLYANYQGKVFRGLSVKPEAVVHFREVANHPDLTKRTFSIPLGFMSSTTARSTMEKFAKRYPGMEEMFWIIHIHGLEPELLRRYEERYPDSVVTSICAMPVANIAQYGESEILLRGAFFHMVGMKSEILDGRQVHTVEMVMLNTNRDHATEHASQEGHKKIQREYFNEIIRASRYKVLASVSKAYGNQDSEKYEELAKQTLETIYGMEKTLHVPRTVEQKHQAFEHDLAKSWSGSVHTWIGDSTGRSFPKHYLLKRKAFHAAAREGNWISVNKVLQPEYDQRRADWFNVRELSGTYHCICDFP
jgi:hypothetical protein